MDKFLTNHPLTLVEMAERYISEYFSEPNNLPDTDFLIVADKRIRAIRSISLGGLLIYKLYGGLEPFSFSKRKSDSIAFILRKDYCHHYPIALMIDAFSKEGEYKAIADYLLIHCVIKVDKLPDLVTINENEEFDSKYDVDMTKFSPVDRFRKTLTYHLNGYSTTADNSFNEIKIRMKRFKTFMEQYCLFVST